MNWYIGQPIVAIRSHSRKFFTKGQEFTIKALKAGCCAACKVDIDIGLKYDGDGTHCPDCGAIEHTDINWFNEICFAPLDFDISELTKILKEPIKEYA